MKRIDSISNTDSNKCYVVYNDYACDSLEDYMVLVIKEEYYYARIDHKINRFEFDGRKPMYYVSSREILSNYLIWDGYSVFELENEEFTNKLIQKYYNDKMLNELMK